MIYLVDRRNRAAFVQQLDEMHRLRHDIYVDRRGWKALARSDQREVDQFDTEDAVYLLGLDELGHFTRYFIVGGKSGMRSKRRAAGELLCAMFEYGLATGLTHYSLLCDSFFLPHMLECKWKVHPLGLPTPYDEGTCIAVLFEVSEAALEGTREARGVETSRQLVFSEGPPPYSIPDLRRVA
jgi:acyl-homoserine lactone synthase